MAANVFLCVYLHRLYHAELFVNCWTCYSIFGGGMPEHVLRQWLEPPVLKFFVLLTVHLWSTFLAAVAAGQACYALHIADLSRHRQTSR